MNRKKYNKVLVSFYANQSEHEMIDFIMEKDNRNTVADCLRTLVKDRFFFLNQNIANAINDCRENKVEAPQKN